MNLCLHLTLGSASCWRRCLLSGVSGSGSVGLIGPERRAKTRFVWTGSCPRCWNRNRSCRTKRTRNNPQTPRALQLRKLQPANGTRLSHRCKAKAAGARGSTRGGEVFTRGGEVFTRRRRIPDPPSWHQRRQRLRKLQRSGALRFCADPRLRRFTTEKMKLQTEPAKEN